jgi:4-hydroxythreonine-4-phosphate dehydrogenase
MTPPLALTMGEPSGIGGEVALMAWRRRAEGLPPFFLLDDPDRLRRLAADLALDVRVAEITAPSEAAALFPGSLPVLRVELGAAVRPGQPDPANATAVLGAIRRATSLALAGQAAGVVTNPIHKKTLYAAGFHHPGHTEFLAELAGSRTPPVMLLACPGLRVVPVTIHLPLRQALEKLSTATIVETGRTTAAALIRDFGIERPALAVAGLNPHAGEEGALGREEIEVIRPAVEALRRAGIDAEGPLPADTLFHAAARRRWDAVLCMYHDQALIPLKTIDFERGVNVTLGLPFVRTSPDHGTAFALAGRGTASPESLMAALRLAADMAAARRGVAAPALA